jgi:hypothetical protein
MEDSNFPHGPLVEAIKRAFGTAAADTNGDGKLAVSELVDYVRVSVPVYEQQTDSRPTSIVWSTGAVPDFIISPILPGGGDEQTAKNRLETLQRWVARNWISFDVYFRCRSLLERSSEALQGGKPLDEASKRTLGQVERLFQAAADEQLKAQSLELLFAKDTKP